MFADQRHQDGISVIAQAPQLHHQTFAGIPCGDPHGIEHLDFFQHRKDILCRNLSHGCDIFDSGLQIPGRRYIADDDFADILLRIGQWRQTQLPEQMPFQRRLGGVAGFKRSNVFGGFHFPRLIQSGRAGELPQIIFPGSVFGQLFVIHLAIRRSRGFRTVFRLLLRRHILNGFFKKRVFQ